MTAIIENQLNSCKETFLEYVIVEELCYHRNDMKLETLTFSDSYRQENKIVNFSDHDHDEHDFCIIENDFECSHRRSLSTPTGCFKIESLFEAQYEQLKDMKKIGFGSQSDVFIAFYKNRHVAVKVMKNHYENEMNNLRKLKHENIVSFIGACTEMNKTFIVMEYCKKGRLYDYLHEPDEPITPRIVLEWSFRIASGMAYLHGHNIIHRDLKSPNILINEDYTLKISDFDLSTPKLTGSTKMPFLETAFWMAPEVIRREACSETVDVWSYGVILWELFTLQIPYEHFEQTSIIFGIGSIELN